MKNDETGSDHDIVRINGRSSSHFTRMTLIFAHELGVPVELVPIHDMTSVDPGVYAGNPALKMPTLRRAGSIVFGAENICRTLAEVAGARPRIVWPEELRTDVARNAQELVWHGMAAQVQIVFGTIVGKLPADNIYFAKAREGFEGALRWLDDNLAGVLGGLPAPRDLSLFEISLFCLVDHVSFRGTLPLAPYPSLVRFAESFAQRPSARYTQYRFDPAPE
jgi:glutathione S-transferase